MQIGARPHMVCCNSHNSYLILQTQQDNLAKIKTGGLLSRADLEASKIAAITNGSSFGDGT